MTNKQRIATRALAWLDQKLPAEDADQLREQLEFFAAEAAAIGRPLKRWLAYRLPQYVRYLRQESRKRR